jgi:hypothetical protein
MLPEVHPLEVGEQVSMGLVPVTQVRNVPISLKHTWQVRAFAHLTGRFHFAELMTAYDVGSARRGRHTYRLRSLPVEHLASKLCQKARSRLRTDVQEHIFTIA